MTNINIRIDDKVKNNAEKVFRALGLTPSAAINLFYVQVARTKSIPFELKIDDPNEETIKAIEEGDIIAKDGKKGYIDIESLKKALEEWKDYQLSFPVNLRRIIN